jgi:omega-amidase
MKLTLHSVQYDIVWEDKTANFSRVRDLVVQSEPQAGGLIVLPEMFATGFSSHLAVTAEREHGHSYEFIQRLAAETHCAVMAGLVIQQHGVARNVSLTCAPDGSVLCCYAKRHSFSLSQENEVHTAGSEIGHFIWRGVRIAPLVCYDLRFPEVLRDAARLGTDLFICIANWPIKRVQHWITLLQARAIENLAWVAGVNRTGTDPQFSYPGRSLVVDPHGTIIADAADRCQVLTTEIDLTVSDTWRNQFPALQDAGLQP